jgi:hypothetical protein
MLSIRFLAATAVIAALASAANPASAQYRGGSDPGRANFATQSNPPAQSGQLPRSSSYWTATDPRRVPASTTGRIYAAQPTADPRRILPAAAHLQRYPPPPSTPAYPATFTVAFPSLRDGYYGPYVIRDQASQPAYRSLANRREDRLSFQK